MKHGTMLLRMSLTYFFVSFGVLGCIVGLMFFLPIGIVILDSWFNPYEVDIAVFSNDRYAFRVYKKTGSSLSSRTNLHIDYVDEDSFWNISNTLIITGKNRDSAHVKFLPGDSVQINLFLKILVLGPDYETEFITKEEYRLDLRKIHDTVITD